MVLPVVLLDRACVTELVPNLCEDVCFSAPGEPIPALLRLWSVECSLAISFVLCL